MPFQSEAQRRYLWANEPEIARDWTDTYGSKIHAADGGIMRLAQGGRIGFFAAGLARGDSISPGTSTSGGLRGGDDAKGQYIQDQIKTQVSKLGAPPGMTTSTGHTPTTKGFFTGLGSTIRPYLPFGNKSLTGMLTNKLSNLFQDRPPPGHPEYNTTATLRNNFNPDNKGGQGIIPMAPYLYDNYYAGVGEDLYDDDETFEEVDDFVQRFRLGDQYRQNLYKEVEDTPITYT
jgi:hypothetical protein